MFVDKLQRILDKRLQSMVASPVIIKVRYASDLWDLYMEVKQLDLSKYAMRKHFISEVMPFGLMPSTIFPKFLMINALLSREDIYDLAEDYRVEKIYYDAPMYAFGLFGLSVPPEGIYEAREGKFTSTYWTKKLIGADKANKKGYTGKEVKVAVPDTGVALYHRQVGVRTEFESVMPFQRVDGNGHGTWCSTCIAGSRAKDVDKSFRLRKDVYCEGMAPDVELLAIKCLGYVIGTGSTSQVMKAMEIAYNWNADVVSMSLGGKEEAKTPEDDPYYHVLNAYKEKNIIACIAAGNEGPDRGTISSPGALPQALTVGAWDPINDVIADFSSRGPTPWGDIKPDVVAPGVNIDSGITGYLDLVFDKTEDRFSPLSGTSMATPHVAGLVALMRQAHRDRLGKILTVDEIKKMMEEWATDHGISKSNDYGWGLITWDIYEWWIETQYGVKI